MKQIIAEVLLFIAHQTEEQEQMIQLNYFQPSSICQVNNPLMPPECHPLSQFRHYNSQHQASPIT